MRRTINRKCCAGNIKPSVLPNILSLIYQIQGNKKAPEIGAFVFSG
jgi:hypothetical protein